MEDKMIDAVVEQGSFVAAFTGKNMASASNLSSIVPRANKEYSAVEKSLLTTRDTMRVNTSSSSKSTQQCFLCINCLCINCSQMLEKKFTYADLRVDCSVS